MHFLDTPLKDVRIIEAEPIEDERGYFCRSWCSQELADAGLDDRLSQCNISFNRKRGTVRGMHFQTPPYEETKIVRCTRGKMFDVIVDIRPESDEYLQWAGFRLNQDVLRFLYIPPGYAHGFQTLSDDCEVFYQMSVPYHPDRSTGFHWQDPQVGICWPIADDIVISDRDRELPLLEARQ